MQRALIEILRSSADERRALYAGASARLDTRAENVEKDLYVCWVLDFLFNGREDDPVSLYFKGGTSLSKAYGLINRFSEDIDIGVYKADIRAPLEAEIAALPSVNQQQNALAGKVDEAARRYISGPLRDQLINRIQETESAIEQPGHFSLQFGFDVYRNKDALDILVLNYKSVFDSAVDYVLPAVRIEGGARPDPVPVETRDIVPYVAADLIGAGSLVASNVTTVKPERTFWEKILILHAMTEMTEKRTSGESADKPAPDLNRYSRHYYDVHQIWTHAGYGKATASLHDLAEACRQHKALMFRSPDHRYDRAVPGTYRLVPTPEMRRALARDFEKMTEMIFGAAPTFDAVMGSVSELETHLNSPSYEIGDKS